jgi:hypothetical protein
VIRIACSHTEGPLHDCATVDQVNKLIPRAELAARHVCLAQGRPAVGGFFAREFVAFMNLMAKEAGLRT